jgi:hypothetical protein
MEIGMQSTVITPTAPHGFGLTIFRFVLKLALLAFLTFDLCAGLIYFLYTRNFRWVELIPTLLAIIAGLFAGLLSRVIYKGWPRIIRWFFSFLAVAGSLAGAGLLGQQWLKVDLTAVQSALVQPDYFILVSMGGVSALMVILAWSKKRQITPGNPEMDYVPSSFQAADIPSPAAHWKAPETRRSTSTRKRSFSIIPADIRKRYFRKSNWRRWKRRIQTQWTSLAKFWKRSLVNPLASLFNRGSTWTSPTRKFSNRLQIHVPEHRITTPTALPVHLPRKHPGRRAHMTVRLIGREEMRCPYCLQVVERNDPKGIVICPICHSAHHKECWDVTGSCQVPHNHAML